MSTYAIAAEGITDQIVLEKIIKEVCGGDVEVNFLQPSRDTTDRFRAEHGGWEMVLEYCRTRAQDALVTNDYLIIQIDTDCGEHPDFGLHLTNQGVARSQEELVADTAAIVARHIGEPLFSENLGRIIIAVAVHSLENWLLFILYDDGAILTGFDRLARRLRRGNGPPLSKTARSYQSLAGRIRRRRLSEVAARQGNSLAIFLTSLAATCAAAADETGA